MLKKLLLLLLLLNTLAVTIVSCADSGGSNPGNTATGNVVHMGDHDFLQTSTTIHKGESITLVAGSAAPHIIVNGSWDGNTPKPTREQGAPEVNNVNVNGNTSQTIGPFNTAGTFHLYCAIHEGMNLTVIVQ
jgi:plastocyanin